MDSNRSRINRQRLNIRPSRGWHHNDSTTTMTQTTGRKGKISLNGGIVPIVDKHLEAFKLRTMLDAGLFSVIDSDPNSKNITQTDNQLDSPIVEEWDGRNFSNLPKLYLKKEPSRAKERFDSRQKQVTTNSSRTTTTLAPAKQSSSPSMIKLLQQRQMGLSECPRRRTSQPLTRADMCRISSRFLPNYQSERIDIRERLFVGVYSQDGKYFLSACQCGLNETVRLYDLSGDKFKIDTSFVVRDGSISFVDATISPDNRFFVYSIWSHSLILCSMDKSCAQRHEQLYMSPTQLRFCIFSVRFTSAGDELLCGSSDSRIRIYNLERREICARVRGHSLDINAVAFADQSSQIFYSGSDDGLCKIWDRRCLDDREPGLRDSECRPVGVLAGHLHGITYIDSRNDGRYLLTNSKDQTIKLWDIRKTSRVENSDLLAIKNDWDYNNETETIFRNYKAPHHTTDNSLMTFRGHEVRQTLIRARFSPEFTTGQRFIYAGCNSGSVHIFDILTGQVIRKLEGHNNCVRDVSWHPYKPELMSSSWDGTIIRWKHDSNFDEMRNDHYYFTTDVRRSRRLAEKRRKIDASNRYPFIQL